MIAGRSPIVQLSVQAATPLASMIALFTLLAGHNQPGGGFAAGLMIGGIIVLRTVAGLPRLRRAGALLAVGGVLAALTALAPLLWGASALDQAVVETSVPLLGTIKTGTALIFDIGVLAIVVGLVVALVEGFEAASLASPTTAWSPTGSPQAGSSSGGAREADR